MKGDPVEGGPIDATAFPPEPDYLIPITDEEVQITSAQEAANRGVEMGWVNTRKEVFFNFETYLVINQRIE